MKFEACRHSRGLKKLTLIAQNDAGRIAMSSSISWQKSTLKLLDWARM
jgi:hypothetical protein